MSIVADLSTYETGKYTPIVYYISLHDPALDWMSYIVYPQPKTEELSNNQLFLDF